MRGIDQRDVRQRLREIAGLATGGRIVLLGQEAKIVGDRDHAVKQLLRASEVARQHIGIRQPQRAGEKRAFCRLLLHFAGIVPQHKTAAHQMPFDRHQRAADARVFRRQKSHRRQQQDARVEHF